MFAAKHQTIEIFTVLSLCLRREFPAVWYGLMWSLCGGLYSGHSPNLIAFAKFVAAFSGFERTPLLLLTPCHKVFLCTVSAFEGRIDQLRQHVRWAPRGGALALSLPRSSVVWTSHPSTSAFPRCPEIFFVSSTFLDLVGGPHGPHLVLSLLNWVVCCGIGFPKQSWWTASGEGGNKLARHGNITASIVPAWHRQSMMTLMLPSPCTHKPCS